jgi:hypothetical protein
MKLKELSRCPLCGTRLCITFDPVVNAPADTPRACVCGWRDQKGRGLPGTILRKEYLADNGHWSIF